MSARKIGTLRETSLHAALKDWYVRPGDFVEQVVAGYIVDIVRGDSLIEIQTGNFTSLKRKLKALLPDHAVHLVYPVAQEKWVCRKTPDGQLLGRRKSPRRGHIEVVFVELVRVVNLAVHPNFSLEVVMIQAEDIWTDDGYGSWRRKGWSLSDRRLLAVQSQKLFSCPRDYRQLLPVFTEPFLTSDLAQALGLSRASAQKMAYCLREMGLIRVVGKRGNALLYSSD
jgi:hypothetical protein